jgi:uncharacterized protein YndB with AHSA1/START domain
MGLPNPEVCMAVPAPFSVSREFDAPRALLYLAHTDVAHLLGWFGPAGAKLLKADLDLRPGGTYHYGLVLPNGLEMWGKQEYREVVAPERLVFLQSFSDKDGGLARHPMAPTWPARMLATTTFEALGEARSRLGVTWAPHDPTEAEARTFDGARDGMAAGFKGMFDQLEAYLAATSTELLTSRLLHASRERVWAALTEPGQVNAWWGPTGFQNVEVEQEVRVGGVWRFKMVGPDGTVYPNQSVYRELAAPERLVYDHGDGERVLFRATITLEAEGGGTRIRLWLKAADRAGRDGFLRFGAIEGGQQTLEKLAAHLR